jgi:hypothetical protein
MTRLPEVISTVRRRTMVRGWLLPSGNSLPRERHPRRRDRRQLQSGLPEFHALHLRHAALESICFWAFDLSTNRADPLQAVGSPGPEGKGARPACQRLMDAPAKKAEPAARPKRKAAKG